MVGKHSMSVEEKTRFFHTELVKVGVDFHQAAQAAKVLALGESDEQLNPEEIEAVKAACALWLKRRQQLKFIDQHLK